MRGVLTNDVHVDVPAREVWNVYCNYDILNKAAGHVIGLTELVDPASEAGVGKISKTTTPPGMPGPGYILNKYTINDNENMIKEKFVVEGGPKALGFDMFKMRFEVIDKGSVSAIVRSTLEYEILNDEFVERASLITTKDVDDMARAVGRYVAEKSKGKI